MKPNMWPVTACLLLSIAGYSIPLAAENKGDYVKALGSEAKSTSTEKDVATQAGSDKEAEPSSTPGKDTDNDQLTEKVIGVLEKTLMGTVPKGVSENVRKAAESQESQALRQGLQSVVSDALDDGTNIDDIRKAVETALEGFQKKQPDVKTEKLQSINGMIRGILSEGSKLAEGNPKDAYIALLQGELDDTTVATESTKAKPAETAKTENKKEEKKTELTKTEKPDAKTDTKAELKSTEQSKEAISEAVAKSPESKGKQGDKYVAKLKDEAKMTFVTIQEGDTLSKIAIRVYGTNRRYWDLFRANQDILGDNPNLLLPGQVLKVPK